MASKSLNIMYIWASPGLEIPVNPWNLGLISPFWARNRGPRSPNFDQMEVLSTALPRGESCAQDLNFGQNRPKMSLKWVFWELWGPQILEFMAKSEHILRFGRAFETEFEENWVSAPALPPGESWCWDPDFFKIESQNHKILYFVDPSSSKSSFESPDSGLGSQNLRPNSGNEGLLQTTFMGIYMKFNISGELCVFLHVFWDFLRFLLKISFIFYQGIWGKTWKWPDSEILRGDEILGSLIKTA